MPSKTARLWARLNTRADWSAELVSTATVADLDTSALAVGRQRFADKHPHLAGEGAGWDVSTLLSKLKLSQGGQLTRAALLLFGKDKSAQFLPLPPQMSWVLMDVYVAQGKNSVPAQSEEHPTLRETST